MAGKDGKIISGAGASYSSPDDVRRFETVMDYWRKKAPPGSKSKFVRPSLQQDADTLRGVKKTDRKPR